MSADDRLRIVTQQDPTTWGECPALAWTAALTDQQRQQMADEARAALRVGQTEGGWSVAEALARDWDVAAALMSRPEFVAALSPDWRASDFWFYSPEWQAGEREVDADLAAGRRGRVYLSDEEFLASFSEPASTHADVR